MKAFRGTLIVLILMITLTLAGCDTGNSSAGAGSDTDSTASTQNESAFNQGSTTSDSGSTENNGFQAFDQGYTEEEKQQMLSLTGTWNYSVPQDDGSTIVDKVIIDNVRGFTFTTGTVNAAGEGTYYSRVGSYSLDGNQITFSATTGGESTDGSSYQLKQDLGVFQYTYALSDDGSQLTLTPVNDNAISLTGADPITLTK